MLLSKEERNEVANTVDQTLYETSADYWDAIIDGELKAQLKKVVGELKMRSSGVAYGDKHTGKLMVTVGFLEDDWQALLKEIQD